MEQTMKTETPQEVLEELLEGNRRFRQGAVPPGATTEQIARLAAEGQHPRAVVLTCSDSRVPPELVFCQGLGELFVVRTAGHVLSGVELGSIEYAVSALGVRLVLVLGHTGCGAVGCAEAGGATGHVRCLTREIRPAVGADTGREHLRRCVRRLRDTRELQSADGLLVVGARYETGTGAVELLEDL